MNVKEPSVRSVAGRYSLIEPLGKGGVGQVWRARDELLRREVAVKEVVFPATVSELDRAAMQARVLREARAAAALPHSSVVTVYDVIRDQTRGYIVMELITASSITELVERRGPMAVDRVARIACQMVEVLEVAHQHGIIHRDVKPGNVMVLEDGSIKLADFGIAWIKDDPKITASGLVLGSPSFMAPEQAQGMESTPATDMWGLGATIYYAVEGELPFDKGQAIATLTSVLGDPPRRARRAGALAPVIRALLAKDPAARPSASQVKALLAPLVSSAGTTASLERTEPSQRGLSVDEVPGPIVLDDDGPALRGGSARAQNDHPEGVVGARRQVPPRSGSAVVPAGVPEKIHAEIAMDWDRRRSNPWLRTLVGLLLIGLLAAGAIFFLSRQPNGSDNNPARTAAGAHPGNKHDAHGAGSQGAKPSAGSNVAAVDASPSAPVAGAASPGSSSTSSSGSGSSSTASSTSTASATGTGLGTTTVGWIPYVDSATGWTISYPPGWHPLQRSGHDLDFTDPNGGRYLRIAWTDQPGPDPAARWREYSKSFATRYPDARTLDISKNFTFKGWKASAWEYTYSSGGTLLHAVDLALVNGTYGFALNFQTRDADWASSQSIFEALKQSFQPPPS
jgi:serine/threonine protein kinase